MSTCFSAPRRKMRRLKERLAELRQGLRAEGTDHVDKKVRLRSDVEQVVPPSEDGEAWDEAVGTATRRCR